MDQRRCQARCCQALAEPEPQNLLGSKNLERGQSTHRHQSKKSLGETLKVPHQNQFGIKSFPKNKALINLVIKLSSDDMTFHYTVICFPKYLVHKLANHRMIMQDYNGVLLLIFTKCLAPAVFQCDLFIQEGARLGRTPAEVASMCDITFSCVSDPKAARDVSTSSTPVNGFK